MLIKVQDVNPSKIEYLKVFKVRLSVFSKEKWTVEGVQDGFFVLYKQGKGSGSDKEYIRSNQIWLV